MGITLFVCFISYLFSCSTERSKRGECCIYGLSPWRMASVGLMHNLSKMMVIPYSAGDATQLEMPAECACMRKRHTKTYSDYRVYKSMNVPVL